MTRAGEMEGLRLLQRGTDPSFARGAVPEREMEIDRGQHARRRLDRRHLAGGEVAQPLEVLGLDPVALRARGLDPLFHAGEVRRHEALPAGQGLAAHVIGRHAVELRFRHLEVVPEYAIEPDLEVGDPGARPLPGLELEHEGACVLGVPAQRVELGIVSLADDPALGGCERKLVLERASELRGERGKIRQRLEPFARHRSLVGAQDARDLGNAEQSLAQEPQVAGRRAARAQEAERPFQIRHPVKALAGACAEPRRFGEGLRSIEARVEHGAVAAGGPKERAERPPSHRGLGPVEELEQGVLGTGLRFEHLEVPERDLVHDERSALAERT